MIGPHARPHWLEDRTASYPNWQTVVRGSVTHFAVRRETHGNSVISLSSASMNWFLSRSPSRYWNYS